MNEHDKAREKIVRELRKAPKGYIGIPEVILSDSKRKYYEAQADAILSLKEIGIIAEEQECDNPYPKSVFSTEIEEVREFVNDDKKFTGISGCYGRHFFEVTKQKLESEGWRKLIKGE